VFRLYQRARSRSHNVLATVILLNGGRDLFVYDRVIYWYASRYSHAARHVFYSVFLLVTVHRARPPPLASNPPSTDTGNEPLDDRNSFLMQLILSLANYLPPGYCSVITLVNYTS